MHNISNSLHEAQRVAAAPAGLRPGNLQNIRDSTEMESLTGALAQSSLRLHGVADRLQVRLDTFLNQGAAGDSKTEPQQPEPQPGTLACLKHYRTKIDAECQRIDEMVTKLSGVI